MVEQVEPVVADLGLRASGRRLDLGGDVRPRQAEWIDVAGRPRLVVDGSDDITRLWDPLSPDPPVRLAGAYLGAGPWTVTRDATVLATAGPGGAVALWDARSGERITELHGHRQPPEWGAPGFLNGAAVLATGGRSHTTVRVWAPETGVQVAELPAARTAWVAWSVLDGVSVLAIGRPDGGVQLWDPMTGQGRGELTGPPAGPVADPAAPGPATPASAASSATSATSATSASSAAREPADPGASRPAGWGCWGVLAGTAVLAVGGGAEQGVRLWDPGSGGRMSVLAGHLGAVSWAGWSVAGDRSVLATGVGGDGAVWVWDPQDDRLTRLTGHTGPVRWGAFGVVDGHPVLATGGDDHSVRLWDPAGDGSALAVVTGHRGSVHGGRWGTVDGRPTVATWSADGSVRLWELTRREPVPRVPGYRSDAHGAGDQLDRQREALALADIITARSAAPPLAIGIFGRWGEGKSKFLAMIRDEVAQRARLAGRTDPISHGAVRQVSFNAWHYAETDLWASLVAELFGQLADPTSEQEQRQRSRLTSELIDARGLQVQLAAAQARLAEIRRIRQATVAAVWDRLPDGTRAKAQAQFGKGPADLSADFAGVAGGARRQWLLARAWIGQVPAWAWLVAAVGVVAFVAALLWLPDLVEWASTVPLVVAVGTLLAGLGAAWRRSEPIRTKLVTTWDQAKDWLDRQGAALATSEAVAQAEVEQLTGQLQSLTAAGQLSGFATDRAGHGSYRERLGVMTEIRRDFEHMAELLQRAQLDGAAGPDTDAVGDELPAIDRIVVYIDDLDRCPPDRVVSVLEAIHLLLAVPLFVVVVAVDPRWLLRSLESHYRDLLTDDGEPGDLDRDPWSSTPAQYLEKIFQIVLTLPSMTTTGYRQLMDDLVGVRGAPVTATVTDTLGITDSLEVRATGPAEGINPNLPAPPPTWWHPAAETFRRPQLSVVQRIDPLALTADEFRLIGLFGPPLIGSPRAVKRFANSYGLLVALETAAAQGNARTSLQPVSDADSPDGRSYGYRAAMTLLATVIAFPMLGPAWSVHLHSMAAKNPLDRWSEVLAGLVPVERDGRWRNAVESGLDADRADQWRRLVQALQQARARAREAGLPLPERLAVWQPWIVPVGRLSFPTGSAVSALGH